MLRVTISPGAGSVVPDLRGCDRPTILIAVTAYQIPTPETYERGFRAIVVSMHRNTKSSISGIKATNYLESILARQEARSAGYDEGLLLNEKENVAESGSGNILLVKKGILKTPPIGSGFIPGVVREVILELAPILNIRCEEVDFSLDDLLSTDEAFLTNSMIEVMPLTSVNNRIIGSGRPGNVTRKLMKAYGAEVSKKIR
jgi:branched-chain amino acid aminotransferase